MAVTFEQVALRTRVSRSELRRWVERRWVLPERSGGQHYLFSAVDEARVRLIADLHHDMGLDEEAIPVVLGLLDQTCSLRRQLTTIRSAVLSLPPEARAHLERALRDSEPNSPPEPRD